MREGRNGGSDGHGAYCFGEILRRLVEQADFDALAALFPFRLEPLPARGGLCVPTGESWTGDEEQGQSRGRAAGVGDRTSGGGLSADVEQREGKGGPQRSPGLSNVSYWAQKELTKLKKYIPSIFFEEVH